MSTKDIRRRRYLQLVGSGSVVGLAGCSGGSDPGGTSGDSGATGGEGGSTTSDTEGEGGSGAGSMGGHLRVGQNRTVSTISPIMMGSKFTERWAVKLFYSTLTRLDHQLQLYGDLATDWSANESADVWTFTIRDDATFHHNGETVTASDVAATFNTVYDSEVGSPGSGTMGDIGTVEAKDETTVEFQLDGANSDFPKLVAKGWGAVVPEEIATDSSRRQELGSKEFGSGPFELESFEAGNQVTGVAYDDYYGTDDEGTSRPYVDRVTARTIPEGSSLVNALKNGDIDIIWEPPVDQWGPLQEASGVTTGRVPAGNIVNFIMDVSVEPWSDERVREAVKLAIDRQAIIEGVLSGLGEEAQDAPLSPSYEYFAEVEGRPPERDLEKARQLLADAGYPDGFDLEDDFDITFFSAADPPERLRSAVLIKDQLSEIGITFEIEQISYDRYINDVWTKAPCYMGMYGMRISGANFMKLLLHSEGGWNGESHFSNEEFDEAITTAVQSTSSEETSQAMATAQEVVAKQGPYAIPYYDDQIGAMREYVQRYNVSPLSYLFYADEIALGSGAPTR